MRILCLLSLCVFSLTAPAQQHVTESPQVIEGPQTAGTPTGMAPQTAPAAQALMSNDTVLRMHTAGLSDDLIVQTVNTQPGQYETGPDTLIELRRQGLSNDVLAAMMARARHPLPKATRSLPTQTLPATAPPAPAPIELSPVNEIGVYYKDAAGVWQPMETEIVHIKSGGFIKSTLTHNIIKEDRNGVIEGGQAKLQLPRPQEFLIYTPDGVTGAEYDLILFRLHANRREFRTYTGGVIHGEQSAQRDEVAFTPTRIAPRTYTFTIPRDVPGGEYGILPPGSGNVTNSGKIYTFAVSE